MASQTESSKSQLRLKDRHLCDYKKLSLTPGISRHKMRSWGLWLLTLSTLLLWFLARAQVLPDEKNPRGPGFVWWNPANTTDGSPLQKNIEAVVQFFSQYNPPNGFATSLGYGEFPDTVYGHSGCYNMSDQTSCGDCIQDVYTTIQRVAPIRNPVGAYYWMNDTNRSCRLRFETYNFSSDLLLFGVVGPNASTPIPAPSPAPPPYATPIPIPSRNRTNRRIGLIIGVVLGGFCLLLATSAFLVFRRRRSYAKRHRYQESTKLERNVVVFNYQDLSVATNNFSDGNKLGEGGFGIVYKARISDGTTVAVKKLTLESHQGMREFVNEINVITTLQHRNLVRLKGYCVEGDERLLVYEFLAKGSLDRALFGVGSLNWQARFQIVIGVARGLAYLHEGSHVQIIHRDIKASNILLDEELQPKISDFGISKLFDVDKGFTSTKVAGTRGYMAPEYVTRGRLTSKADVFGFGVLALEIVTGRMCVDSTLPKEEELLVQLAWNLYEAGKIESCVDRRLGGSYVPEEAHRLIHIALLCTQEDEQYRPVMSNVVAMLLGYLQMGGLPNQAPIYLQGSLQGPLSTVKKTTTTITELEAR